MRPALAPSKILSQKAKFSDPIQLITGSASTLVLFLNNTQHATQNLSLDFLRQND
jgi:hypothetical protein